MPEITKKLHYRKGGVTVDIKLYDSTADIGSDYLSLRVDGKNVYAKLGATTEMEATDLRVRKGGVTYAVLKSDIIELPSGFIGMFMDTCPTGWTRESDFDGKYLKGSATPGQTGGSAFHTHAFTIASVDSTSVGTPLKDTFDTVNVGGEYPCYLSHLHETETATYTTASTLVQPPYVNVIYCRKN